MPRTVAVVALAALALVSGACGSRKRPLPPVARSGGAGPTGAGASARPPAVDPKDHELEGKASWYGKPYHGRKTASGERYDMNDFTAAHRTLPFGTLVRVENLENRLTVVVRINDRGPFVDDRVIDVSYAAARALEMLVGGVVPVRIVILGDKERKK
ncbi:MAG: septal ring lytic transglycosylase RlpA family protein [Acidobacteria bacterium]|nr:septal ring lytic transglycosylase RlpA family protein [Acidobacteriota bacterium]